MDQTCNTTGIMSDENGPASVGGNGTLQSGSETVAPGAMHLSGGSHADLLGVPGMQFLGTGGLQVDFVDLSAVGSAGPDAGPISFTEWRPGGASVPAVGFDAAAQQAAGAMLADFATGSSNGVPGGAMQPDASGRVGGASFGDSGMPDSAWVVPPRTLP